MAKRIFDLILSSVALILLAPILILLAILVRIDLGSPVLFIQTRAGLHGKPFRIVKFRTMTEATAADGTHLPDGERLTRFGRFLRLSSLDELPELWNVLKGDMSFVGPRPLLMEYLDFYSADEMQRHSVRPGITGLSQVSGRNMTPWDRRLAYDIQYVEQRTFWLDIKILSATIVKVIKREGVVENPSLVFKKLSDERRAR